MIKSAQKIKVTWIFYTSNREIDINKVSDNKK